MMQAIGSGLLTVALVLGLALFQPTPDWTEARTHEQAVAAAWADACELSTYSCFRLDEPEIVETNVFPGPGTLGYYFPGDDRVHIRRDKDLRTDFLSYAVLVHEMVHYIQDQRDWPDGGKLTSCLREEEAWDVFDAVATKYGKGHLVKNGMWQAWYGC